MTLASASLLPTGNQYLKSNNTVFRVSIGILSLPVAIFS